MKWGIDSIALAFDWSATRGGDELRLNQQSGRVSPDVVARVRGDRRDPPRDRGVPGRCAERFGEDDQRQLLLLDRAPPLAVELDGVPVAEAGVRLVAEQDGGDVGG